MKQQKMAFFFDSERKSIVFPNLNREAPIVSAYNCPFSISGAMIFRAWAGFQQISTCCLPSLPFKSQYSHTKIEKLIIRAGRIPAALIIYLRGMVDVSKTIFRYDFL
jgi:hypothetical protein